MYAYQIPLDVQVQNESMVTAAENVAKTKAVLLLADAIVLEEEFVATKTKGETYAKAAGRCD